MDEADDDAIEREVRARQNKWLQDGERTGLWTKNNAETAALLRQIDRLREAQHG